MEVAFTCNGHRNVYAFGHEVRQLTLANLNSYGAGMLLYSPEEISPNDGKIEVFTLADPAGVVGMTLSKKVLKVPSTVERFKQVKMLCCLQGGDGAGVWSGSQQRRFWERGVSSGPAEPVELRGNLGLSLGSAWIWEDWIDFDDVEEDALNSSETAGSSHAGRQKCGSDQDCPLSSPLCDRAALGVTSCRSFPMKSPGRRYHQPEFCRRCPFSKDGSHLLRTTPGRDVEERLSQAVEAISGPAVKDPAPWSIPRRLLFNHKVNLLKAADSSLDKESKLLRENVRHTVKLFPDVAPSDESEALGLDFAREKVGMIKSDLCRLVMMYKLGGYYFDTDPWLPPLELLRIGSPEGS
eukprot:g21013.t1